jgi:hypothetical protein
MEDKEANEEFHPAVTLMLARMESNPKEFMNGGRFRNYIDSHNKYLTKPESAALTRSYSKIHLDELHAAMMKAMLAPEEVTTVVYQGNPAMNQWGKIVNNQLAGTNTAMSAALNGHQNISKISSTSVSANELLKAAGSWVVGGMAPMPRWLDTAFDEGLAVLEPTGTIINRVGRGFGRGTTISQGDIV